MPELPDLLYITSYLRRAVLHRTITDVTLRQPVVLRNALNEPLEHALDLMSITSIGFRGPFLVLQLSGSIDIVVNLMLSGKLQHQQHGEHELGHLCLSLKLDDGSRLNLCDDQKMAKVYLIHRGEGSIIPGFDEQGVDVMSEKFTRELFLELAAQHRRKQVRVFVNSHNILSSIGNAYADEILFDAGIHPKSFVGRLTPEQLSRLYDAIRSVLARGIKAVEEAHQPIHKKVRDHMQVRNRKGQPCLVCGTIIRREGVHGYDVFFCPHCQPPTRELFIDWPDAHHESPE
jgi:formamidopyrimidine-DNA glycosylase